MATAVVAVSSHARRTRPVFASGVVMLVVLFIVSSAIMAGALPFLVAMFDMSSLFDKWMVTLTMLGAALGAIGCVIAWEA